MAGVNVEWVPFIHKVFYVTDSINVAQDFMAASLLGKFESLELNVPVVLCEIDHVVVQLDKGRPIPLKSVHVNDTIQVKEPKCNLYPIPRSNLNLILSKPRK